MIQLDEQMCYWVNRSVVGGCWVYFSSELSRGSKKKNWKQMQKMEVFEDRKGFWLLLHEANRSCLWRKENGRQVGKTYLRSVWSQALEAQSS